ncbi:hypothetical protein [Cellulosimicrobium cellulans]|uniref:hypothetical protein n=1 Tax=Cellulosimicrobium cellulans TaxID=1710 RepID=UPI003C4D53A4
MIWTPTDEQVRLAKQTLILADDDGDTRGMSQAVIDAYERGARAVLVAVGPHIAAQALRHAAGDARHRWGVKPDPADWLTTRADQIEKEAG